MEADFFRGTYFTNATFNDQPENVLIMGIKFSVSVLEVLRFTDKLFNFSEDNRE